ncbi:MAG: aminotransferase class V-fold PLP-dependent enzyme [Anaerolineales bacterium]|nr:aminotransferase class V-fold PLP-dependent enzyme [Anaerolineales bacterium]
MCANSQMISNNNIVDLRNEIVGIDQQFPLLDGSYLPYVSLDNAASTPSFRYVQEKVNQAMELYSSVHRGSGYKSLISTYLYDEARRVVLDFVGGNADHDVVIFSKNTSEAINKLAALFPFQPGDMVLTTTMEHHSNDLPWRARAHVLYTKINPDGTLDMDDYQAKLEQYKSQIKLVTVTGASNVSGFMPPIHEMAEMAHRQNALFLADCAQLIPHRKVDMGTVDSPGRLDFVTFSGHKVYAPYGAGGLIGPKAFFETGEPDYRGGGTIEIVTLDEVTWAEPPDRDEVGSPNVIGAVAIAATIKQLSAVGMDVIAAHEAELTAYALKKFNAIQGLKIYGIQDPSRTSDRVGVIPLDVEGIHHGLVAAVLSFEGAIGVRNGCFCAHPYILELLHVSHETYMRFRNRVQHGDRSLLPGLVRVSFGCYNNFEDIDRAVEMFERIIRHDYKGDYVIEERTGSFFPRGFELPSVKSYFEF